MYLSPRQRMALSFVLAEILLLPYALAFALLGKQQGFKKLGEYWLGQVTNHPIQLYGKVLSDPMMLKLFLLLQGFVVAFLLTYLWRPEKKMLNKKTKRLKEGVGGPAEAGDGQHGTSRWQTEEELDATTSVWHSDEPLQEAGLIIGMKWMKVRGRSVMKVWSITRDGHTLIIGATRSGKSRRIVMPMIWKIPQLAKKGESMILSDPKGELYDRSHNYLREMGYDVVLLDFRNPKRGNQWNLMYLINEAIQEGNTTLASEIAWDVAHTIVHQKKHSGDPIWANGQESVIAALMLAVATEADREEQKHLHTVYSMLAEMGETIQFPDGTEYNALLSYLKTLPVGHIARSTLATARVSPEKMRSSFLGGATVDLRLFADPSIAKMTSVQDHDLAGPGKKKTAVFMVIPDEKSTRHVLATLYVSQTYEALVQLANQPQNKGRLPIRVHYILDEFGNLPPIPDFGTKITVSAGRGICFHLIIQDLGQIKKKYKEEDTTITGNCGTWIYLLTRDLDTAKKLSEMTGKYTVATQSHSATLQTKDVSHGFSSGLTARPLLMPDEILRMPENQALVLQARQFPAITPLPDLSLWPADEVLEPSDSGQVITFDSTTVKIWLPNQDEDEEVEEVVHNKKTIFDLENEE